MKVEISYKIPFYDTDSLGIIWYGNYYKYFELVRNYFLKKIKFDIPEWKNNNIILVIVESNCRYIKPLKYNDKIKIIATLKDKVYRFKLDYNIYKSNVLVATGYTIQVAVSKENFQTLKKLPNILRKKLK